MDITTFQAKLLQGNMVNLNCFRKSLLSKSQLTLRGGDGNGRHMVTPPVCITKPANLRASKRPNREHVLTQETQSFSSLEAALVQSGFYEYVCAHAFTHTHSHTCILTHAFTHTRIHIHAFSYTRIHTHAHTHSHTHAFTRTRILLHTHSHIARGGVSCTETQEMFKSFPR